MVAITFERMDFNDIILSSLNGGNTDGNNEINAGEQKQKGDDETSSSSPAITSTTEKRRTIYRNINKLSAADKQDVLAVIVTKGLVAMIKSCSEGVVINLNNIDIDTINQMYYMLDYKLNI